MEPALSICQNDKQPFRRTNIMKRLACSLLLLLVPSACSGQAAPGVHEKTHAARQTPAVVKEAAAEAAPRVNATHVVTLRKLVGKTATVYGHVARTGKSSRSGHQFLNFANTEFTVVCLAPDVARFTRGAPADLYQEQDVEVTGKIELYRGKLQIRLREPPQIKLTEPDKRPTGHRTTEPGKPAKFELRQIGRDAWMSPAGLTYRGRDPAGLTRLEHVLRHARDDPKRDGPHGVFDGGADRTLAVIDEAWRKAQEERIRPDVEGTRSAYLVPLGRRIGYLGGRTGASRRNPPLSRVFIVIETDTKNVVTAFPR